MKHEALLNLLSEVTAQRDDYVVWQAQALGVVGRLVQGQPEVKPGAAALDVLEAYVARLVKERDDALADAMPLRQFYGEPNGQPVNRLVQEPTSISGG